MKKLLLPLLLLLVINVSAQTQRQKHQKSILVDTHNDVISNELITKVDLSKRQSTGNFDLIRAEEGGLNVQVFSIWCGEDYGKGTAFNFANREIDSLDALIKRNPGRMVLVRNSAELERAVAKKQFAAMIGVEGGHMIEDRMDYIDALAKRGMRYLTLTWNNSTSWSTSAADETHHKDSLDRKSVV